MQSDMYVPNACFLSFVLIKYDIYFTICQPFGNKYFVYFANNR